MIDNKMVKIDNLEMSPLNNHFIRNKEENENFRQRLTRLLHSHRFHLIIVGLVILDCVIVVAELMIDLQLYNVKAKGDDCNNTIHHNQHENSHTVAEEIAEVLHYISICILCLFMVEIIFKIYAFRIEYFHHFAEVFDAIIISTSLTLDLIFLHNKDILRFLGIVIVLRLWRVIRIIHGIAISVKTPIEDNLEKEKSRRKELESETADAIVYINSLESEIVLLRKILKRNRIVKEIPDTYMKSKQWDDDSS